MSVHLARIGQKANIVNDVDQEVMVMLQLQWAAPHVNATDMEIKILVSVIQERDIVSVKTTQMA